MNIWYLHHYATPYELAGLHRPFEFGKYFIQEGHKITVFTSSYLHYANMNMISKGNSSGKNLKRNNKILVKQYDGINTVFVKTCGYEGSGWKRIENMLQFGWRLLQIQNIYNRKEEPDIIIASSPHPFTMLSGIRMAKKFKIPCICEIRDLWPEVFFWGGKISEKGIMGRILLWWERYIYEQADALVFLKEGDHTYISDHKWDRKQGGEIDLSKCYYVNNGVDLQLFDRRKKEERYQDPDLDSDKFRVVYCGTIRPVNNIGMLLDVAKLLDESIEILIYGSGNCVEDLKKRIKKEKIKNVKLKGYVDNQYIPSILERASVTILNYSNSTYNWSRGNSSNKLFEYLASGKPVISTVKMGYDILERYACGVSVNRCTAENIADQIIRMKQLPEKEYYAMCCNARVAAEQFDIIKLSDKFMNIMEEVAERKKEKGRKG